jgi:hypothetical protein
MRSTGIAATLLLVTLAVAGCKHRKEEPIPGPRAGQPASEAAYPSRRSNGSSSRGAPDRPRPRHGASGISWFQGGFEEAFSCPKCAVMLWREASDRQAPAAPFRQ